VKNESVVNPVQEPYAPIGIILSIPETMECIQAISLFVNNSSSYNRMNPKLLPIGNIYRSGHSSLPQMIHSICTVS